MDDYESQSTFNTFTDKSVRQGFIRKVYSILSVQLLLSLGFILVFTYDESSKGFARQNPWVMFVALIASLAVMIPMACSQGLRRKTPHNFILLGLFTLAEGVILGFVSAYYRTDIVLMAIGITAIVVIALTIFAFQTKIDFTAFNGIMFVALIILMIMGFVVPFFPRNSILRLVYSGLGAFIFAVYLIIDTQSIVKGESRNALSPEEYIFGALVLYMDVINLFLYILSILDSTKS